MAASEDLIFKQPLGKAIAEGIIQVHVRFASYHSVWPG
jgi:hypothetical protein